MQYVFVSFGLLTLEDKLDITRRTLEAVFWLEAVSLTLPLTTPCEFWLMPASYTSGQPPYPRRHLPTCRAWSQRSHTVSSMPCLWAWTSAPLSVHLSTEWECAGASNRGTRLYPPHNISSVHLSITYSEVRRFGRFTNGMRSGRTILREFVLPSPTLAPTLLAWICQEQHGSCITASAPVLDVSAPAYTNGVCTLLRPVSVVQKNKPPTMLSSNVPSIDLCMDCTVWRFCMRRQSIGCSTPDEWSSAAKQWIITTRSNEEDKHTRCNNSTESMSNVVPGLLTDSVRFITCNRMLTINQVGISVSTRGSFIVPSFWRYI